MEAGDQLEGFCHSSSKNECALNESVIDMVAVEMRGNRLRLYLVGRLIQLGSISLNAASEGQKKNKDDF